jgi:hypothetical protein
MKTNKNNLFSFSAIDSGFLNTDQDKIQIASCPRKETICKEQIAVINKCYAKSEQYYKDKDFERSLEILQCAFNKTSELSEISCSKCAVLFRSTITESVNNIHGELRKMTNGLFRNRRFESSFIMADKVLNELKNVGLGNVFQLNESIDYMIGNYHKRKVS